MAQKFAHMVDGVAVEVVPWDPAGRYPADWVWIEAPDDARQGSAFDGTTWTHPEAPPTVEPPAEPEPTYRTALTPAEFRNLFSAFEEVALNEFAEARPEGEPATLTTSRKVVAVFFDRVRDPHLKTVDLADPRNLAGLDLLVSVGVLSPDRRTAIARGMPG